MNLTNLKSMIILTAVLAVVFTGCKKDKDNSEEVIPENAEQNLKFHIHNQVGNQLANYTNTYTQASGRKFILADFRYYLSNIKLVKEDGSELALSGKVLLAKPSQQDYDLGMVPVGNYKGLKFILGLDSATNHLDPTTYATGNPLAIQTPSIHWSWSSGYIFFKVEGVCDTTAAANGPADCPFFYHIGMDSFKRNMNFSTSAFTVANGSDKEIAFVFDLLKVLQNVDMRSEQQTHTMDNMMLATKIANNFPGAMSIE
ncbi:MAG: hypothetical protein IPP32_17790 [Bacteroidetes bacterium]|nr:hypothetical protein [Bacteroidota bacterium]